MMPHGVDLSWAVSALDNFVMPHGVDFSWAASALENFVWDGNGPMMHWSTPALISSLYLAVCVAHSMRRTRPPPLASARTLDAVTALHNFLLAAFSAVACAAGSYHLAVHLGNGGLHSFLCPPVPSKPSLSPPPLSGALHGWCYIFYLSKYWELVDTLLLISRGKRAFPVN